MKTSCGAILYSFDKDGKLGLILGSEGSDAWLPFKGVNEPTESFEETAKREIKEETCNLVDVDSISLDHVFSTHHKIYRIGIYPVDIDIIEQFKIARSLENRKEFKEKHEIRFFPLENILKDPLIHDISRASIKFYWDRLNTLAGNKAVDVEYIRCHGMSEEQAKAIRQRTILDYRNYSDEKVNNTDEKVNHTDEKVDNTDEKVNDTDEKVECSKVNTTVKRASSFSNYILNNNVEKYNVRRKSDYDYIPKHNYKKREYNLSRPRKIGIYHTPTAEKIFEDNRVWR